MGDFKEISMSIISEGKEDDLLEILDNYFSELKSYYPDTYNNFMRELEKMDTKINIENQEELNKCLKYIDHEGFTPDKFWTVADTTKVGEEIGIDFKKWKYNKYSFNYVMNMVKADNFDELTKVFGQSSVLKQTVLDNPSFYAHLAKAWLNDEDAPSDKLIRYINCIVLPHEDD